MLCGSMNMQRNILQYLSMNTEKGLERHMSETKHRVERAIIVAAGIGKRLHPVTLTTPKPLVSVNGVRMIDTIVEKL